MMNKKKDKKAEAKSRANHPTARTVMTEPGELNDVAKLLHQNQKQGEADITIIWARALTDQLLLNMLYRVITEPRGWKGYQKQAILTEVLTRFEPLLNFETDVQAWINQYADALRNRENGDVAAHTAVQGIAQAVTRFNNTYRQKLDSAQ